MMKNLRVNAEYGVKTDYSKLDEWQQKAHPYTVTLKYGTKQMTIPFFMGSALTHEPTAEDVLPCLVTDYSVYQSCPTFEMFADDLGYDEDSRRAEKQFKAIQQQAKKLEKLLGPDLNQIIKQYENY